MSVVDDKIGVVIARLARPRASGGYVVGHAAILAEGAEFAALEDWILDHGGTLGAPSSATAHGGLHAVGRAPQSGRQSADQPRHYLLPATAFTPTLGLVDDPQTSGVNAG
jgi:hypothetical protein